MVYLSKFIIGIDGGSQSTKLVLFDLKGNIVNESQVKLKPLVFPEPGLVEYQDDDLWTSLVEASQSLFENFKGNKEDIIAIGLGSIRFCRVLLNREGYLAQPVMSWMDERVGKPHVENNQEVEYITTATGYLGTRLTGNFKDTVGNYQGIWPIDIDRWSWSDTQKIRQFNVSKDMLYNLVMPGDLIGHITTKAAEETDMPEGLPVVATSNDKAVEALGAGLQNDKTLVISLGTYITSMIIGDKNYKDPRNFWVNFSSEPLKYLYESNGIRRGMWTVSWFKELLGTPFLEYAKEKKLTPEDILNQEASQVKPGSEGLMTVLDWLAPEDKPYRRGMILGFNGTHKRAHIYRSILEGIALTMKNNVDLMLEELDKDIDEITVTGGGSNSDLLMQIISDVFNKPVNRNVINETASLGAAICASVYKKQHQNFEDAVNDMVKIEHNFLPNHLNNEIYTKINNQRYKKIYQYSDDMFKGFFE